MAKKKPKISKDERQRAEVEAACKEISALLKPFVGFAPQVEAVHCGFLKRGGGLSLGTIKAMIERLAKPARAKAKKRRKVAAQRELFTKGK